MCLLSSIFLYVIGIVHSVLQMLCCGQSEEFCHIESCGKNNVTSLLELQLTLSFLHIERIYIVFMYQPDTFQKLFKILQNGRHPSYNCIF